MNIIDSILNGNYNEFKEKLFKLIDVNVECKLQEIKQLIIAEEYTLDESKSVHKAGRLKLLRGRFRKGVVQNLKPVSNTKMTKTSKSGNSVTMTPIEMYHRKIGSMNSKMKRRGNMLNTLIKRSISTHKRHNLGL